MKVQRGDTRWGRFADYLDETPWALVVFALSCGVATALAFAGVINIVQWATS